MKIIMLILLSFSSFAEVEFLFEKGSYEVIGKVSDIKKGSATFDVFKGTTSQSTISLKNTKGIKLGKITMKLCIDISEKCNWKCSGELGKVISPIEPWNKITLKSAIKKVKSCR